MKHKGSSADFIQHRNETIYRIYRNVLRSTPPYTRMEEIYKLVSESGAPRYWVTDTRAAIVISAMEKADKLAEVARKRTRIGVGAIDTGSRKKEAILNNIALGTCRVVSYDSVNINGIGIAEGEPGQEGAKGVVKNMYRERREMYMDIYLQYKNLRARDSGRSLVQIMADIIYRPAPRQYISLHGIKKIVEEYRSGCRKGV